MGTAAPDAWWLGPEALPASARLAIAERAQAAAAADFEAHLQRLIQLPPGPAPRHADRPRGEAWPAACREHARAAGPITRPMGRGVRSVRPRPVVLRLAWLGGVLTASLYMGGLAETVARWLS